MTVYTCERNAPVDLGDEVEVEPLALRLRADDAAGVQRAAQGLEEFGREERLGGACVRARNGEMGLSRKSTLTRHVGRDETRVPTGSEESTTMTSYISWPSCETNLAASSTICGMCECVCVAAG